MVKFKINPPLSNGLTESEVQCYLEYFKNKNYENEEPGNCGNQILGLMMKFGGGVSYSHSRYWRLKKDEKLYRTRPFEKGMIKKIKNLREYYSPSSEYVRWGRLNKEREPILYTAFKEETAYNENSSISKGFLLIEYIVLKEIDLLLVGKIMESPNLLENSREHHLFNVVNTFLEKLMLEKNESENYYRLTNGIIEKVLFGNKSNGYVYQSAAINGEFNAALNTKLEETMIKINCVWYCEKKKLGYKKKKIIFKRNT